MSDDVGNTRRAVNWRLCHAIEYLCRMFCARLSTSNLSLLKITVRLIVVKDFFAYASTLSFTMGPMEAEYHQVPPEEGIGTIVSNTERTGEIMRGSAANIQMGNH